jgi:hypothetical protein
MINRFPKTFTLIIVACGTLLASTSINNAYSMLAFCQSPTRSKWERVIKEGGWEIPGLAQSEIVDQRHSFKGYSEKPVPQLYVIAFKPSRKVIVALPQYFFRNDEEMVVRENQIEVRSIEQFDVNKKVFCYVVGGLIVISNKITGESGYAGIFIAVYYDNDGDGKFEAYDLRGVPAPFIPKIPKWVSH